MSGNKPFCDGKHRGLPEDAVGKAFAKDYVPPAPAPAPAPAASIEIEDCDKV